MSTERIVVQRSVADKFRKVLAQTAEKVYGKDSKVPILVTPAAVERNRKLVADAVSKGATILFGDPNAIESCNAGMRPIIVDNVRKGMDLYETESFGPTVSLIVVDGDEEAIAVANDTEYGLSSAIFTESLGRGLRISKKLETG